MINNRKLVLDTFCEVYDLLKPYADAEFWRFSDHTVIPNAVYLIGRQQVIENLPRIKELASSGECVIILSNPAEGSDTQRRHCIGWGLDQLIQQERMLMVSGGDIEPTWPNLIYDSFLPKILDYKENIEEIVRAQEIYTKLDKPYKFLFLNGRHRLHRQQLIGQLDLSASLWTNLDTGNGPVNYLPAPYEVDAYQQNINISRARFAKNDLFNNEWGEIYLKSEPYVDTYFSLITETVFEYPYSFRTEKIWKPIAIGHPFIAVANRGYYRDLHRLGFKTFGHVIDESFDLINNNQDRLNRITEIVRDLCSQDLVSFLKECYNVCKYNQQHLSAMSKQVRKEFPQRFIQFIHDHNA